MELKLIEQKELSNSPSKVHAGSKINFNEILQRIQLKAVVNDRKSTWIHKGDRNWSLPFTRTDATIVSNHVKHVSVRWQRELLAKKL